MLPNAYLGTPRTPKHLLEAPIQPRDTSTNFTKSIFGLEIAFFKLEGPSSLKKRVFEQFFAFKIFL